MSDDVKTETRSALERLFGRRPGAVIVKLLLISLLVGFVMSLVDFNVGDVVRGVLQIAREALRDGAGLFQQMGVYILTGAGVVIPIWLLLRLTRGKN